jgi:hypothetical protein
MDAHAEVQTTARAPGIYLPVNQLPPSREVSTMTSDERTAMRNELVTARAHQEASVKARDRDGY